MTESDHTTAPSSTQRNGSRRDVVVATYDTYREAAHAVDLLKNLRVPQEWASIVPRDIVVAEAGGEMNLGKAVLYGASAGGLLGFFMGVVSAFFNWTAPAVSDVWAGAIAVFLGVVFGAVIGVFAYWAGRDVGDGQKRERWEAGHYDVVTDEAHAEEAHRALREKVGAGA